MPSNLDPSASVPGDLFPQHGREGADLPGSPNILVLAECWDADGTPNKFNYRHECAKLMELHAEHEPWFGTSVLG